MENGVAIDGRKLANGSMSNGSGNLMNEHPLVHGMPTDSYNFTNGDVPNGISLAITNNGTHGVAASQTCGGQVPIAICGMACRLPGGLTTPEELWNFLLARKDARVRVPESRYNVSSYHSATSAKPGTVATEHGYFLDESIDLGALDTSFFSLPRSEVERADPQQRQLLEVARECFEDAGLTNWRGKTIGCYAGSYGEDWVEMFAKESQQWGVHRVVGTGDFALSNRLSYEFDLRGPSMTIRTGCSSALVCLNEACAAISRGDCEGALIGGVNLILAPGMTAAMTEQGVLSKDGSCKTFSADANGYARGEAVAAIFVKPLADAIRDGNPVRAVIRATSHNVDGRTPGLSQPSTEAQVALMRRAYSLAGIPENEIGLTAMVECHGTGTPIGDPIEAKAVARVFGKKGVFITSVKPNLGHAEGASGLVSLIKVVKTLEHRTIPPNIRFTRPNPDIPFEEAKLTVPVMPTTWPQDRLERVSLNSFGIGGANAHVILDSAASFDAASVIHQTPEAIPQLLLYTANSADSLARMIDIYQHWVEANQEKVADLSYTLALRRAHLPHRAFAIVTNGAIDSVSSPVHLKSVKDKPNVVMVFTGQGAQWPRMGRELLQSSETFRSSIRSLDQYLQQGTTVEYTIEEELKKPPKKSRISSAELSQPLCTALQIALVDTLKSLGIVPRAVVGHSSGEIAAAYAAGALTAAEAILIAHCRGAVTTRQKRMGSMAAIGMSREDTEKHLVGCAPKVTIACDNSPKSVTISGDTDAVKTVIADIQKAHPGVLARLLQVDKAYHSYHMAEIGEDYLSLLGQDVVGKEPSVLFFSSVTGKVLDSGRTLGPQYWRDNLQSLVRFREAASSILDHDVGKNAVFLEIGPHSALAGPLRQIFTQASAPTPYVAAMTRNQNSITSLLTAVGKLHSLNVPINFQPLFPDSTCLPDLPRYPWDHSKSYWYESRVCKEWRHRKHPCHDLLGVKLPESTELEPVWRNMFHLGNAPWMRDHRLGEDIVFPFAGYIVLAGEAVRQITGIDDGFSIRNIIVHMALVLNEGRPTEMITSFRPHPLTNSLNSPWWEFTVASYNGHVWTKHCTGEASALLPPSMNPDLGAGHDTESRPGSLPRSVNVKKWYANMRKGGLDLGPCFQALESIETSTNSENRAIGKVVNGRQGDEANYHIHPTVIDATIQLLGPAAVNGYMRKNREWLPTSIDELSIRRCTSNMVSSVAAHLTSNNAIVGHGRCTAEGIRGMTVMVASGVRMSPANGVLSDDSSRTPDTHAAARYEWALDIDFMSPHELVLPPAQPQQSGRTDYLELLEELGQLCLLSSNGVSAVDPPAHLQKYVAWLDAQTRSAAVTKLASVMNNETAVSARVEKLLARLSNTPAAPAARAIHQVCTELHRVLSGQATLETILPNETLAQLYAFVDQSDSRPLLRSLSHSRPNLRILELGGIVGTGRDSSAAPDILRAFTRADGHILCSKYTFTSPGFISGRDQPHLFPNMEYSTLDIEQDPAEQGFDEDRRYDLIIAANVLHTSRNIQQVLAHVKKLLHPDGRLLLKELSPGPSCTWVNYVFGMLPSWTSELTTAGFNFGGIEGVVADVAEPSRQLTATVIARHANLAVSSEAAVRGKKLTVLCEEEEEQRSTIVEQVLDRLQKVGYQVTLCNKIEDASLISVGCDVLCLLDLDTDTEKKTFFEALDEARFLSLKTLIHRLGACDAGILWVTRGSQVGCRDPRYAQVLGFARTVRSEMLADFATCEVDDDKNLDDGRDDELFARGIVGVLDKFRGTRQLKDGYDHDSIGPDFEWAIGSDGRVRIGRFHPFTLRDELLVSETDEEEEKEMAVLDVATPGRINTLQWLRQPRIDPKPDEVEIQVHSAGLNFRDVLVALGIVELPVRRFGIEAAGFISRVGSAVDPSEFKVGDRVVTLKQQAYSTYLLTPAFYCIRIPDQLTFDEAASMLMPYVTAIHSLENVARLAKGQSVLIHSACGGVGLAAVQIAQMLGAKVYATVSSDEKVNFLMESFRIPRNRIFQSRDKTFVDGVMRETGGQGVDVILNSLSGELLHATWTCLADFGILVEIGKRDLIEGGKLDLRPFLANRTYSGVDIDQLWTKPTLMRNLIHSALDYYVRGDIAPIRPIKIFPAAQTQDAFRYMQKGLHIGRIGISIQHPSPDQDQSKTVFETVKRPRPIAFDKSGSYLLVGGLGGLGRAISRWMVDHGARALVYLSRSAGKGSKDEPAFVHELESMGCNVKLVAGDVAVLSDVKRAVAAAMETQPLKGVIQMSMVLRDQNLADMTFAEWTAATAPKVRGTWNLHEAVVSAASGVDLDFMVLFSSLSGVIGQPGQANYASANTFLDAFAQYRNSLGMAASVVDIGAVEDIGFISEHNGLMAKMKTSGFKGITEQELLDAMTVAMLVHSQPAQRAKTQSDAFTHANTFVLGLGSAMSLTSPTNRAVWRKDRRMAAYHNRPGADGGADGATSSNETLKAFLTSAKADPSVLKSTAAAKFLAVEIGKKLFDLLLKPSDDLNTAWPLVDLGMDSLVALELRAWWRQVFAFDISTLEMLGMGSLDALGQHAVDELLKIAADRGAER